MMQLFSSVPQWHRSWMLKPKHFIKAWRKKSGLSQEQAAERIGITRTYLSKIERGKRRYDEPFLEAASTVYDCRPKDLISRHPNDPELPADLWNDIPTERKPEALKLLRQLTKRAA